LLGVAIEPLKDGVKVLRVVPNTPADREKSKLTAGDVITAVEGVNITSADNFYAFFINKTDIEVLLQVKDAAGKMREVIIIPEKSINSQLYEEWVRDRRALTDKLSGGKLGYLHIEGMDWESFERFEREITAVAEGKEGIVIDVRYNGGGWTTDYLMIALGTRQHAYTVPRGAAADLEKEHKNFKQYYPYSERLPFAVWTKSSIALCNESSYSNAEIFSHAYKNLKMGTLVGMPTYGAVISTGGRTLIDGSLVRLPFRGWYSFQGDENMELIPAKPDVLLDNAPDSKFKGRDEQLEKAVQLLLKK
jgi:C-terminal processing protease CtpA/Prc